MNRPPFLLGESLPDLFSFVGVPPHLFNPSPENSAYASSYTEMPKLRRVEKHTDAVLTDEQVADDLNRFTKPAPPGVRVSYADHVWSPDGFLKCCIRCETPWSDQQRVCDPRNLEGKTENCCECGYEYPRSELLAGHIYCKGCRPLYENRDRR